MRVLALDIGEKRIGVAVSDPSGRVASPVAVLDTARALGSRADFLRLQQDYDDIELLLVGLPRSLDGSEGPQAARVREIAARIATMTGLPVAYCDERLSSVEAERRMAEAGADSRARRGSVDMVAAALMLQTHLDEKWSAGEDGSS